MVSSAQTSNAITQKQIELRNRFWPKIEQNHIWKASRKKTGYTTIPRCMPHIMQLMNDLSPGSRVSETYFALWCRVFQEFFLTISNHSEMAYEAGFSGQRAHITWLKRMEKLEELEFILSKEGPSGKFNYVLILNPYHVIKYHEEKGNFPNESERTLNGLFDRISQIRASDMDDDISYIEEVIK
jgi:hypothetical protein